MAKSEKESKAKLKALKAAKEKQTAPPKKGFPPKKDGKSSTKKAKKKPLPTYKAPADFKPHFLLVQVRTEADGLLGTAFKATRYQGRFDRDADDKKKFDLGSYDPQTLLGVSSRMSAVTYKATNDKKYPVAVKERAGTKGSNRLPPKTVFQILLRVGRKSADNTLTAGVKAVFQAVQKDSGRTKLVELDKTDPVYRAFRKSSRILPAAFVNVQMPPKRTRGKKEDEE